MPPPMTLASREGPARPSDCNVSIWETRSEVHAAIRALPRSFTATPAISAPGTIFAASMATRSSSAASVFSL